MFCVYARGMSRSRAFQLMRCKQPVIVPSVCQSGWECGGPAADVPVSGSMVKSWALGPLRVNWIQALTPTSASVAPTCSTAPSTGMSSETDAVYKGWSETNRQSAELFKTLVFVGAALYPGRGHSSTVTRRSGVNKTIHACFIIRTREVMSDDTPMQKQIQILFL